ncbi:MAG: GNAT family N-acetyltransferase [Saprospiraceae bacterium]
MKVLETDRTYLREMTADDGMMFYMLNLDHDVIKYTGDKSFKNIEAAEDFLSSYDHYKRFGFGRWAVIHKIDEQFLGWCGLKYTEEQNEFDIGFRFFKEHWGQGFATETAKACVHFGFITHDMPEIVGRAMKENIASIRVLEKIGLTYSGPFDFDGKDGVMYKLSKSMFKFLLP